MSQEADAALRRFQAMMMAKAALAMLGEDEIDGASITRSSLQHAVDQLGMMVARDRGLPAGIH